jgi:photosystem II stability/assembly factor-like uncharacterized protein
MECSLRTKRSIIVGAICAFGALIGVFPPALATAAPVTVGLSGWTWGDPTPQGNTLNDVAFIGSRGFAVGNLGTVLRSEDGGRTWAGLASGIFDEFSSVQEIDPDTIVIGGECSVGESVNDGASFQRLPIGKPEYPCTTKIASFSFPSTSTGFVEQVDGTILLTTDGGETLQHRTPVPLEGASAGALAFVSPSTGLAIADGDGGGRIFRTTDGAQTWTQVASATAQLTDVMFVTPTTAYAIGAGGTLLASTDEGVNWTALPLRLPAGTVRPDLTQISCSDETHCLIATAGAPLGRANVLVRTSDGGETGSIIALPSGQNLLAVSFVTGSEAVAVGEGGATVLSSDGGATFTTLVSHSLGESTSRASEVRGPFRVGESPLDAYAPWGRDHIAGTTDGGNNWSLLRVPTREPLVDVSFPTTRIGYALNSAGRAFRTTNSGQAWSILPVLSSATALLAPNVMTVLLIGPTGVLRSTDAGARFHIVDATIVTGHSHGKERKASLSDLDLSRGAELAGRTIFAYGKEHVLESTNGGTRWRLIPNPLLEHTISAISFVSPTTGYEISDGLMFFTGDRGRNWREILSVNPSGVESFGQLSFANASEGYVTADEFDGIGIGNVIQRTDDGGHTWIPEPIPSISHFVTDAGSVAYAAPDSTDDGETGGYLFETTDGGLGGSPSTLTLTITGPDKLSIAELERAGDRVHMTGQLTPAVSKGIYLSYRTRGQPWRVELVPTTPGGTFEATLSGITATTDFFAQWAGDELDNGAGTPATQLTVTDG